MEDETVRELMKFAAESFIPKALFICLLGNLINFVILSRPCIKSSTNIYLSILAFADAVFMIFIYVFSMRYRDDVHHQNFGNYWRMFGLSHWIYRTFLYITVYVTLSLTLDRYEAVRHPARTNCGIARAKNAVSMVLFVCFLFSISAAFEYQLVSEKSCQLNRSQVADDAAMTFETGGMEPTSLEDNERTLKRVRRADSGHNFNSNASMSLRRLERSLDNDVPGAGINATDDAVNSSKLRHKTSHNPSATTDHYVNDAQRDNATSRVISQHNHNTCSSHFLFYPVDSDVAKNRFYRAVFNPIAAILLISPMGAVMIMSCWLSTDVYRTNKLRLGVLQLPTLTDQKKKSDILIRESKITLLVITLVVIFLICHTPNAVYALYKAWLTNRGSFSEAKTVKSFNLAFEVSCQILMSINCCSKISVYLLLSDDYWTSLRSLKSCFQCSTAPGEQIVPTSKHLFPSTKADVESLLSYSLNKKRYCTEIPPEARHHRHSISMPRIHKLSVSSQATNESINPQLLFVEGLEMERRQRNQISVAQVERHPSTRSAKSYRTLQLSPSQASLARSKSLNIQSTMQHSPNCRLHKKFLN